MSSGTIILIGGLSSSGKTSIARELQKLFAQQSVAYLHMPIDAFMQFLPEQWFCIDATSHIDRQDSGITFIDQRDEKGLKTKIAIGPVAMHLISAYFPTIKILALRGNNVISDAAFSSDFLKYGMQELAGLRVYSISIRCPLEITQAREIARGAQNGGYIGLSRWYAEETDANTHELYDFMVDSSHKSPQELALEIYNFVTKNEPAGD
jgi:chloramphenicol 3-O-phosphotransferase